ncbi:hypothetical protein A8C56_09810 [Niabella ginsenosidivorans]|uniref:FAS1 domain-containing protein n=2 Tax=Niabella ginsenosidivorans TaxID=1176587 RepID=A0A1A9I3I1_9BACT|nr:hypothetical protein A8C56_09810 [Niabella ginsenosidivorans]
MPADTSSQPGLAATITADADYSLYNEVIKKSGYSDTLNNKKMAMTLFVPTNAAVKAAINLLSGGAVPLDAPDAVFTGFIQSANFPANLANGLVKYNTVPQSVDVTTLSATGFNFMYPTMINPAPQLSALARLSVFLSKTGTFSYVNNVPVTGAKKEAGNGVYYPTGAVVMPPQRVLWQRISEAPDLTYLKAAVERADSGLNAQDAKDPEKSMVALFSSFGPNITLLAPTDAVFKTTLTGLIYQKLALAGVPAAAAIEQATAIASTPAVFTNPTVINILTAQTIRGLLAYHIVGATYFTNNFPSAETDIPTLLSLALGAEAPKLKIRASFTGPSVSTLTVKGAVNPAPANVIINPLPEPNGSSDQFYVNGTLHKIDQILLPLQL